MAYFKNSLHTKYTATHFPKYLQTEYGKTAFQRVLSEFATMGIPELNPKA